MMNVRVMMMNARVMIDDDECTQAGWRFGRRAILSGRCSPFRSVELPPTSPAP